MGTGKLPEHLVPGGDWPDEPRIAEFLQEVRPLIAQIEQAGRYPTPVWQPIAFNGFSTLLPEIQASRAVIRLLQLEVQHALYHRDTERALRGLAAMQTTAAAFEWDFCMVADLVGIALRSIHRDAIRQSLAETDWEPAQLDQLLAQVQHPRDVRRGGTESVAGERAMTLAWLQGSREDLEGMLPRRKPRAIRAALLLIPSGTKKYLDHMAAFQRLGEQGVLGIAARAQDWEKELSRPDRRRFDRTSYRPLPACGGRDGRGLRARRTRSPADSNRLGSQAIPRVRRTMARPAERPGGRGAGAERLDRPSSRAVRIQDRRRRRRRVGLRRARQRFAIPHSQRAAREKGCQLPRGSLARHAHSPRPQFAARVNPHVEENLASGGALARRFAGVRRLSSTSRASSPSVRSTDGVRASADGRRTGGLTPRRSRGYATWGEPRVSRG